MNRLFHYLRGSRIVAGWIASGGVMVSQEWAERRSDACLKCPMNRRGTFTGFIGWIALKLAELRARRRVRNRLDAGLKTCSACDCPLKTKVRMPLDEVAKGIDLLGGELAKFHEACWIRSELLK